MTICSMKLKARIFICKTNNQNTYRHCNNKKFKESPICYSLCIKLIQKITQFSMTIAPSI